MDWVKIDCCLFVLVVKGSVGLWLFRLIIEIGYVLEMGVMVEGVEMVE